LGEEAAHCFQPDPEKRTASEDVFQRLGRSFLEQEGGGKKPSVLKKERLLLRYWDNLPLLPGREGERGKSSLSASKGLQGGAARLTFAREDASTPSRKEKEKGGKEGFSVGVFHVNWNEGGKVGSAAERQPPSIIQKKRKRRGKGEEEDFSSYHSSRLGERRSGAPVY